MNGMEINIEFERECYRCGGSSRWSGRPCDACNSTGLVLTELGEKLLEFLERHQTVREKVREE